MSGTINVTRSSLPEFDAYVDEIRDLWDSRWLTNMGDKHKKLEAELCRYLNMQYVSLFSNGHLGLECVLEAFQLAGEVITTPFTFISTTHAIVRNGLIPVFCDITMDDYTIDVNKLENLITERTSAIIPVHVYGNICDVKGIDSIARKHNLKVIYDAAHAFGAKVFDRSVAAFGDASMFSFHATKVFNTIEGGAVALLDGSLKRRLESLKNFGITGQDMIEYVGTNAKMNEFQAAMGLCNLRRLEEEIQKRKTLVDRYRERLDHVKGIKLSAKQNGVDGNYAYFPVVIHEYKYSRDEIFEKLKSENIHARKYFYPLTNHVACYKDSFNRNDTPIAEFVADRVLTLPLYADLRLTDVDRICDIILN